MLPIFFLLLNGAAAVENSAQVLGLIGQTRTDVVNTNRTFADYESFSTVSIDAALNTYNNASLISTDLQNTIDAVALSNPYTLDQSEDIFVGLTGLLPPVFDLLNNLVRYCNAYLNLGVASLVLGQLQSQRDLTNQEVNAISAKAAGQYPSLLNFGSGLLLQRFDVALDVFQSAYDSSTCPPPGSTAFPSATATRTVTVTATGTGGPGKTVTQTKTATITKTVTLSPGGGPNKTVTKTVTTGAPNKTVTKTITTGAPNKTVTKTITTGAPNKTVTKTQTITKGPTITKHVPGPTKTVTTHCTVTLTKTKTVSAPPQYCPH